MTARLQAIATSTWFRNAILIAILIASVLIGAETYDTGTHRETLEFLNRFILWIFVVEALIKMGQYGRHWYRYFLDPWNVFDFSIVAICFIPADTAYAAVLRLTRVMRALRLATALPQLQIIVGALIKSIPSMAYVGLLLTIIFYTYAIIGFFTFGENDPVHFRDLHTAMLTLFRVVTLEDWTDVMYIQMYGSDIYAYINTTGILPVPRAMPFVGVVYFVSFVMFGTMIMLNLFIGVIINSMEEAQQEHAANVQAGLLAGGEEPSLGQELSTLELQMDAVKQQVQTIRKRIKVTDNP